MDHTDNGDAAVESEEDSEEYGAEEEGEILQPAPLSDAEVSEAVRAARGVAGRLGIRTLYREQERSIEASLAGHDVLVVMPTGFGKSVCYQIPSMILPKPVVLVSPLLALIRDQHEKLLARRIPVERIDGTIRGTARKTALKRVAEGGSLLVMTTPETLGTAEMGDALGK